MANKTVKQLTALASPISSHYTITDISAGGDFELRKVQWIYIWAELMMPVFNTENSEADMNAISTKKTGDKCTVAKNNNGNLARYEYNGSNWQIYYEETQF